VAGKQEFRSLKEKKLKRKKEMLLWILVRDP